MPAGIRLDLPPRRDREERAVDRAALEGRRHVGQRVERHHGDGLGIDAVLARDDLDRIVHRGAGGGHADALAGEILDRAHARVPRRLGDGDGDQRVARLLRALRRDHLQPALGGEVVEARGEGGHAEVGVARDDGERRLGRGGEVLDREIEARLLEPALLLRDEHRPRRGEPQQRDRRLGQILGLRRAHERRRHDAGQRRPTGQTFTEHPRLPFSGAEFTVIPRRSRGTLSAAKIRHFLLMPQNTVTGARSWRAPRRCCAPPTRRSIRRAGCG